MYKFTSVEKNSLNKTMKLYINKTILDPVTSLGTNIKPNFYKKSDLVAVLKDNTYTCCWLISASKNPLKSYVTGIFPIKHRNSYLQRHFFPTLKQFINMTASQYAREKSRGRFKSYSFAHKTAIHKEL